MRTRASRPGVGRSLVALILVGLTGAGCTSSQGGGTPSEGAEPPDESTGTSPPSTATTNTAAETLEPADVVFAGGQVITMDDDSPEAEAVAVRDGRIVAVGSADEVLRYQGPESEVIDLDGNTLMPGLIEAHTHPVLSSQLGQVIDVSGFTNPTVEDVMNALREGIAAAPTGEWVRAYGWDPALVRELRFPSLAELDALAPDNPLIIVTQTIHTAIVNTRAYGEAGITKETPDPPGGSYDKDEAGELNGVVREVPAITPFILSLLIENTRQQNVELVREQYRAYAEAGYTTIQALGIAPVMAEGLDVTIEVAGEAAAPVRTYLYFEEGAEEDRVPMDGNERFRLQGIKLRVDGSPYAGGMAMYEPYLDTDLTANGLGIPSGSTGELIHTQEEMDAIVEQYFQTDWQLAVHVQGDRAVDQILNSVERALQRHPDADHRFRMEHNALITPEQIQRAVELGVTFSFYIDHVYFYGDALHEEIVGPARAARFMPVGSAIDAGGVVSLHTDTPSSPLGPFRAMRSAVLRETNTGTRTLGADERISAEDAIKAVTINAAWQAFAEDDIGSVEVGKLADFTVVSQNLLRTPPDEWAAIEVVDTYLAGDRVTFD